ncbi:hypothetical protein F0L74_10695 [Chitinophaga agrisoli]|uniref:Uncharacterized protein n=1 Tax=Chitinophaga agrisoli TaxID=2607653 RepID=A0A5B2VUR3_9BACT|nr:hypothetical protein [Chitinophaga agrisoli]KAA2242981.1 hypothetical protein F0L74_10695 [Chitinophaga agrisoli]
MSLTKVFITLKNGKPITRYYQKGDEYRYTLELSFNEGVFKMHSYAFHGNDVMEEDNHMDETRLESADFNEFVVLIQTKFPNVDI